MKRNKTFFPIIILIIYIFGDLQCETPTGTCVDNVCIPSSYSRFKQPRGLEKVFIKISGMQPFVLREVDDFKKQLTVDLNLIMIWHDPKVKVINMTGKYHQVPQELSDKIWQPRIWLFNQKLTSVKNFGTDSYTGKRCYAVVLVSPCLNIKLTLSFYPGVTIKNRSSGILSINKWAEISLVVKIGESTKVIVTPPQIFVWVQ